MLLFVTGKGVFVFHFHALLRALWNVPVLNFNMSAFQFAFPVAFERFFFVLSLSNLLHLCLPLSKCERHRQSITYFNAYWEPEFLVTSNVDNFK